MSVLAEKNAVDFSTPLSIRLKDQSLLSLHHPVIMGVVNCTAHSLYGFYSTVSDALVAVEQMVVDGATIIDVGAEATNPQVGFQSMPPYNQRELDLLAPMVESIAKRFDVLISVDTSQAMIMKETVALGAGMINDQRALRLEGAMRTVAELGVPVCLMHLFLPVRQPSCEARAVMLEKIHADLSMWVEQCLEQGIAGDRLIIDPGFGQGHYGKNTEENFYLLAHLKALLSFNIPILVGLSRKSMIANVLDGAPVEERLYGSLAAAMLAIEQGAAIIRTHDVKATNDVLRVMRAYRAWRE